MGEWTKTPPSEPGTYRWRNDRGDEREYKVHRGFEWEPGLMVECLCRLENARRVLGGEWYTTPTYPIEVPE